MIVELAKISDFFDERHPADCGLRALDDASALMNGIAGIYCFAVELKVGFFIVYVGKATNLRTRFRCHAGCCFGNVESVPWQAWRVWCEQLQGTPALFVRITPDKIDRTQLEDKAIKVLEPVQNILLSDSAGIDGWHPPRVEISLDEQRKWLDKVKF